MCEYCGIEKQHIDFYKSSGSRCRKCVVSYNTKKYRDKKEGQKVEGLDNEEWRWVIGFENYYMVSSLGRIKSVSRWISDGRGFSRLKHEMLLKGTPTQEGYLKYGLSKDGVMITVVGNQVVAKAFIVNPRPDVYFQTNHKNAIRFDNRVVNLEWCDADYNNNYKYDVMGYKFPKGEENKHSKLIEIIHPDGKEEIINGIMETSRRLGIPKTGIQRVLKNDKENYKGYKFKYAS